MNATFISRDMWAELTRAVRKSPGKCLVAVAYFGKGAARLLPLTKGSQIVVDASERAVKSGQTCPADLLKLVKQGVEVFSVQNLHAKVFVLGSTAYIGSNNVSSRSASQLIEAAFRTSQPKAVGAAKKFVQDHCLQQLGPESLKKLGKIYRPPHLPGGGKRKAKSPNTNKRPTLSPLFLAQLVYEEWSDADQRIHDSAKKVAQKRMRHKANYALDSFRWSGNCPYHPKDRIIQVTDEGNGKFLVAPVGEVLHLRKARNAKTTFIYLEHPARKRRPLKSVANKAGCTQKRLRKQGRVKDDRLAETLQRMWHK